MKKIILPFLFILCCSTALQAQKKSDLIYEVDILKKKLAKVKEALFEAQKNEKVAKIEAESFKAQVTELQDANTSMMKSLTSFTEVSAKNSDNMNKAMESLKEKEQQLKGIHELLAKNDSTALIVLTNAKQTLGEDAKIGVSNGMVIISSDLQTLFGSDTGTTIKKDAEPWVEKIGQILIANPGMAVTIEGLSMTGNLELPAQQAAAISSAFQKLSIAPERITALGKDGNLKEGVVIKIHPKYDEFYLKVKESMKQAK